MLYFIANVICLSLGGKKIYLNNIFYKNIYAIFKSIILIQLSVRLCVCDHWTHRLRDGKKKSDGGRREK